MKSSFPSALLAIVGLAAAVGASPLTPDAFYVAPHDAVLAAPAPAVVDPPCDPIHPSSIWPAPGEPPEWASAECWYIYLGEWNDAIWDYTQCGIECTFDNPEGPARCACYAGCVDALNARREECWGNLMECSEYYPGRYAGSILSR